jgi:serine/threonine protein kinase/tetratricopeptide (TPR) repeat protein
MNAEEIFHGAIEKKNPTARTAYLDAACGENRRLRCEVEGLLRTLENAGNFLEGPLFAPGATDEHPPGSERPGTVIGPYKLLQQLGEGGMGIIFLAEQTHPVQRKVAVKVIKPGMDSSQVLARFEQERQALAVMDHPNIAKVLDAGTTDSGRPFFVMELVKGVPITNYCDQEHLPVRERLELFIPVCQAVQHAHQKGIIHRDLKPSNMLIALYDGEPVPKVIDFGVAKATGQKLTEKTLFTEVGQVVGTLEYMAPEQAELNNLDIDTRADIYALGTVLYQLLAGSPPFTREQLQNVDFMEMLRMIREVEPPKPSTKLSSSTELPSLAIQRKLEPKRLTRLVQGDLDWIVMKCLDKERNRRYETANGLAVDIGRYLAHEPVLAGPPSAGYRMRKFVRRNRIQVIAASLVLLAFLAGITGTTYGLINAEIRRSDADRARADEAQQRGIAEANEAKAILAADAERKAKEREADQRMMAETEKRTALALRDFLQMDLLMQADARMQANRLLALGEAGFEIKENPTIKELLERAEAGLTPERIEQKFPNQPLVQAEILYTVGATYHGIGEYVKAIDHYRRSADLFGTHLGSDNPTTLGVLSDLAEVYNTTGKTVEAITLLEKVRDAQIAKLAPNHPELCKTLNSLAGAYYSASRIDEAILLYEKVRDISIANLGPDHANSLKVINNLAVVFNAAARRSEALALFEKVRDTQIAKLNPDHPDTLTTLYNIALLYWSDEKLTAAIALLERVRDSQSAKLGSTHPNTLLTLAHLADMYSFMGKTTEAVTILEKVRNVQSRRVASDHPRMFNTLSKLAAAYKSAGRAAEAIELFEKVRDAQTAKFGPDHAQTLLTLNNLATAYHAAGRTTEAVALLEKVRDVQIDKIGPNHSDTLAILNNLGECYKISGRTAEALALLEKVRDGRTAKLGSDHLDTIKTLSLMADLYRSTDRIMEAIPLLEKVRDVRTSKLGPDHRETLATINNLASAFWSAGKLDQSIPLFEQLLPKQIKLLGIDDPDTVLCAVNLAVNYRVAERLPEAARLIDEWFPRARAKLGAEDPIAQFARETAANIYEASGQLDRVIKIWTEVLTEHRKALPPDDPRLASTLAQFGFIMLKADKPVDAEPILRECLAMREKKGADLWTTFNAKSLLGASLLGQKKFAAAEPLLIGGYEGMKQREAKIPAAAKIYLTNALERLVNLYDNWEKKDEADKWRIKLEEAKAAAKPPVKPR